MKGLLVRVGIDSTYGEWNAPVDPETNQFVYLPIPESDHEFKPGLGVTYDRFESDLEQFSRTAGLNEHIGLPSHLVGKNCHLDPDFDHLTYGDQYNGRGSRVKELREGDFIAFYASFRPVRECPHALVYALFGMYFVKDIKRVLDLEPCMAQVNAHMRRKDANPDDLVVFADSDRSGRFDRSIPIGSYRDRAYRVTDEILELWGGLDVANGYIQRSANPPWLVNPSRFLLWLDRHPHNLLHSNN